jgi:hypothetical protein
VKQTDYRGVNNTGEREGRRAGVPGGSTGIGGGYIGSRGTKADLSTSTIFMINREGDNKFDEREFIEALAAEITREIEETRAIIVDRGSPASNEFFNRIQGWKH